jgi:hypothetical protein
MMESSRIGLTAAAFAGLIVTTVACSPDTGSSAEGAGAVAVPAVCPSTPAETAGAACGVPGLRCGPQYPCGLVQASLLCVCTEGAFQCTDGTGRRIADGGKPMCPQPAPSGSCPASETRAQFATCGEQGLLCAYQSPCSRRLDQCQCFSGPIPDGGVGLRFECIPALCNGPEARSAPPDSGPAAEASAATDSGLESSADTGAEAGGSEDADATDGTRGDATAE